MTSPQAEPVQHERTSELLKTILANPPADATLGWLLNSLPKNSFGIIMLLLCLIAMIPFISIFGNLLIILLCLQIVLGHEGPTFPKSMMKRKLPASILKQLGTKGVGTLQYFEKFSRPRWRGMFVGKVYVDLLIVSALMLLAFIVPLNLVNIPLAMICAMIALSYIEHDGLLLLIAHAFVVTAVTVLVVVFT